MLIQSIRNYCETHTEGGTYMIPDQDVTTDQARERKQCSLRHRIQSLADLDLSAATGEHKIDVSQLQRTLLQYAEVLESLPRPRGTTDYIPACSCIKTGEGEVAEEGEVAKARMW